jgi:sulfur transfer protein SufE
MTASTELTLDRIAETFEFLDDWESRFTYLLDLGKRVPEMPLQDKTEATRVHGCQATVHLSARRGEAGRVELAADADAATVKGLIAILLTMYSGRTAQEILTIDAPAYFTKLGLEQHLSPTRRNGLHAMIQRIRAIAEAS